MKPCPRFDANSSVQGREGTCLLPPCRKSQVPSVRLLKGKAWELRFPFPFKRRPARTNAADEGLAPLVIKVGDYAVMFRPVPKKGDFTPAWRAVPRRGLLFAIPRYPVRSAQFTHPSGPRIVRYPSGISGGLSRSQGLQAGQGAPAPPQWQASALSLAPSHGLSG
jgi:hypothetical protein